MSGFKSFILLGGILLLLPTVVAKDFTKWYPFFNHYEYDQWTLCDSQQTNMDLTSDASCRNITNCILGNLSEDFKAMLGSIGVFLGFTPTLIVLMGPSVMDVALLSLKRPFLSTLLACGTPGFFFDRPFKLLDTESTFFDTVNSRPDMKVEGEYFARTFNSPLRCKVISWIQYFLSAIAAANTIHNSYQIGLQAVISFSCHTSGRLPLGWYSFSIAIHLLGIVFMHSTLKPTGPETNQDTTTYQFPSARDPGPTTKFTKSLKTWLKSEPELCCQQEMPQYKARTGYWVTWGVLVRWSIDILVVAQFAMGTLVMSSVYFVRIEDAVGIVCRYLISAFVVRCIVAFEIEGMKFANGRERREEHPMTLLTSAEGSSTVLLQD